MKTWCIVYRKHGETAWHFLQTIQAESPRAAWRSAHEADPLDDNYVYGVFALPEDHMELFGGSPARY